MGVEARGPSPDRAGDLSWYRSDQDGGQDSQRHVQTRWAADAGAGVRAAVFGAAAGRASVGWGKSHARTPSCRGYQDDRRPGAYRYWRARQPLRISRDPSGRAGAWPRPEDGRGRLAAQVVWRGKYLRARPGARCDEAEDHAYRARRSAGAPP